MKSVTPFLAVRGFTLIELMVTLAVGLLLTTWVVLGIQGLMEKQRLGAAVEAVQSQLIVAKSEVGKRSQDIAVRISPSTDGTPWILGLSDDRANDFDCDPKDCTLTYRNPDGTEVTRIQAVSGTDYPAVVLRAEDVDVDDPDDAAVPTPTFLFDAVRAVVNPGTLTLRSPRSALEVRVAVNAVGQLSICSPNFGRYPACP